MLKVILAVGAPASGKSTWARAEVAKDPDNWVRINNDDIRAMTNGSVYSPDYDKFVSSTRLFLIKEALKRNKNVILDNVNANKRHFEATCKIAEEMNKDIQVFEKAFYEEFAVLVARDAKREGKAKVGETVVKQWFDDLGGKQFKFYHPKVKIFTNNGRGAQIVKQDETLPPAIISDLDGTLALFAGKRSPYDAKDCDLIDEPNPSVVKTIKLVEKINFNQKRNVS
jgi:predicted kinase